MNSNKCVNKDFAGFFIQTRYLAQAQELHFTHEYDTKLNMLNHIFGGSFFVYYVFNSFSELIS